ncbi:MAG: hypothetical protein ACOYXC_14755 [Candidatus Rifleibacteriota bacterium]
MKLCENCKKKVLDEEFEGCTRINGFGTSMIPMLSRPCPNCGAKKIVRFFTILYIPIIPFKAYLGYQKGDAFMAWRVPLDVKTVIIMYGTMFGLLVAILIAFIIWGMFLN